VDPANQFDPTLVLTWLIGSNPMRMRFAFKLSFSHAMAKICSACTDVRCAGVGRVYGKTKIYSLSNHQKLSIPKLTALQSHPSLVFLFLRHDFK
jgi:hypothetical protein